MSKNKKCRFFLLIFVVAFSVFYFSTPASASTLYFTGNVNSNWSNTGNWSTVSSVDTGTHAVPTATDDVIFDATSPAVTLDVATAKIAKSITFASYTNTATFNVGLTVSGAVTLGSAMTIGGSGSLSVDTTATLTSNTKTWPNGMNFSGTSQTYTLADNWTVSGSVDFNGTTGTILNGNSLSIGGSLHVGNVGTFAVSGTTNFTLNGTGTWYNTVAATLKNNVTINTAGTITFSGTVLYSTGTLTYTAGTIVKTGSTLSLGASTTLNTSGMIWNNVTFSATQTTTISSDLRMSGNLNVTTGIITINGAYDVKVGGNFTLAGTPTVAGTASFVLNGTGTVTGTLNGSGVSNNITINTTGTITFANTAVFEYKTGTFTYTTGTVVTTGHTLSIIGSATVNTSGMNWNNIDVIAGTLTNNSTTSSGLSLNGNLTDTLAVGALTQGTNAILTLKGTSAISTLTATASGNTVKYTKTTGAQTVKSTTYNNLTIDKTGQTATLAGNTTVNGTLTITNGTLDVSGSNYSINLKGDYANSGTFTAQSGTLTLSGTATQTLSGTMTGGSAFYNLTITNNFGTNASDNERTGFVPSVIFSTSATSTNNYSITTASVRVEYNSGSTYTFNNINWNGQASGTRIYFRNSNTTGSSTLNVSGTQTAVSYVNVSRSNATNATPIDATNGTNFDAGNNSSKWIFFTDIVVNTGTDTANPTVTIAPSGAITELDQFTLATNLGTDTITSIVVSLYDGNSVLLASGSNSLSAISDISITNSSGSTTYFNSLNPTVNPITLSSPTTNSFDINTTPTNYKVRITPQTHSVVNALDATPGVLYTIKGIVTALTSVDTVVSSTADNTSTTVIIDNLSASNVSGETVTSGDSQMTVAWTNPVDSDFSSIVVLRDTSSISDVPTEGATYSINDTIGTSTVRYISSGTSLIDTGLSNGTIYYYKIFTKDSRGNYSTGSSNLFDSSAPTVSSIVRADTSPTNASSIAFTVTFSKIVTGVGTSDFTLETTGVSGASVTGVSGSGTTYTVTVGSYTGEGTIELQVPIGATITDFSGNSLTSLPFTTGEIYTVDTTPPSFTIQYYFDSDFLFPLDDNYSLKAGTYYIKITASEALVSTPTISISAEGTANDTTNATTTLFSSSSHTYQYIRTIVFDASAIGSVLENISVTGTDMTATSATDVNPTNESTKASYTDTIVPTVTIATSSSNPTSVSPIPFTATFSESVIDFGLDDIDVEGGVAGNLVSVDGANYTFDVSPNSTTVGSLDVFILADTITDNAFNNNLISNSIRRTFNSVAPVVILSTDSDTDPNPINTSPILITATFVSAINGGVTGFDDTDPQITNGTISDFTDEGLINTGDGTSTHLFTFNVTPIGQGYVTIFIPAGSVEDIAEVPNDVLPSNTLSLIYDSIPPIVSSVNTDISPTTLGNNTSNPQKIIVTFNEDIGRTIPSISIDGDGDGNVDTAEMTADNCGPLGGIRTFCYDFSVPPLTGIVTKTIYISLAADLATNAMVDDDSHTFVINTLNLNATINQASGQSDPTTTALINFTVVFSEAIDPTTFTSGDITISGTGTATAGTPTTADNITWNVPITATVEGTIIASLSANKITNTIGNDNLAASSSDQTVTYALPHTLTYTAGTGGTITGSTSQTVSFGSDGTTVTAVPSSGYSFVNWTGSYTSTSLSITDTNITGDITETANFSLIPTSGVSGHGTPLIACKDPKALNYSISGAISNPTLCQYEIINQPFTPALGAPGKCLPNQIITQNLKAGSRNGRYNYYTKGIVKEAKILQAHMNRLGFASGPEDGIIGPITNGAIKRMQKYLGTKQDGLVGPITRGLINNSCGKK